MKATWLTLCLLVLVALAGCGSRTHRSAETAVSAEPVKAVASADAPKWQEGEVVELTGTIWPARSDAPFFLRREDGDGPHLRSGLPEGLTTGTRIRVKGTVHYVHYPRPKDYYNESGGVNYGVAFPQTFCYLDAVEYEVLAP